jgi:hypothetical protein
MSKADIVREGLRLGVDFAQTVSCYQADAQGRAWAIATPAGCAPKASPPPAPTIPRATSRRGSAAVR